jgi:hypothetical protein
MHAFAYGAVFLGQGHVVLEVPSLVLSMNDTFTFVNKVLSGGRPLPDSRLLRRLTGMQVQPS